MCIPSKVPVLILTVDTFSGWVHAELEVPGHSQSLVPFSSSRSFPERQSQASPLPGRPPLSPFQPFPGHLAVTRVWNQMCFQPPLAGCQVPHSLCWEPLAEGRGPSLWHQMSYSHTQINGFRWDLQKCPSLVNINETRAPRSHTWKSCLKSLSYTRSREESPAQRLGLQPPQFTREEPVGYRGQTAQPVLQTPPIAVRSASTRSQRSSHVQFL